MKWSDNTNSVDGSPAQKRTIVRKSTLHIEQQRQQPIKS